MQTILEERRFQIIVLITSAINYAQVACFWMGKICQYAVPRYFSYWMDAFRRT